MSDVAEDLMVEKTMPVLDVPKVGYDNTVWSEEKRMLTIGAKTVQISPDSTKKIPTFSQYLVMANAIRRLLDEEMESTIRGMYYATLTSVGDDERNRQKFWNSQENSDDAIKAIELLTSVPREEFSKIRIYSKVQFYSNDRIWRTRSGYSNDGENPESRVEETYCHLC